MLAAMVPAGETTSAVPLPSRLAVGALARRSVGAASAAAARLAGAADTPLDGDRIAVAYSSERWFRLDGARPDAFAPLSGFFRAADGWVRTHGNYPHHARALTSALGLPPDADADAARAAFLARGAQEASAAITSRGGVCVPVLPEDPAEDAALRARPLVTTRRLGEAPPHPLPSPTASAPLSGIRVLDLTRVIAGPVATRTLALLGADVLRIDPPGLPEIGWQHLETGHGKRSALLDLADPADRMRFDALLADADVIALGYRRAGLDQLGLSAAALARRRPGIVVVQHTAWDDPDRRGFDSVVQAGCGISWIESAEPGRPGAMPAQALDHSAGYLLAAAAMDALARRAEEGGSWAIETSLRRVAAELLGMPRTEQPSPGPMIADATGHTQAFAVDGREVVTAAPAIAYAGGPTAFGAPRPWGRDAAAWA